MNAAQDQDVFGPDSGQNMPDCLRRPPMTVLQPASTTPDPMKQLDTWPMLNCIDKRYKQLPKNAVRRILSHIPFPQSTNRLLASAEDF